MEVAFDSQAGSPSKPNEDFVAASPSAVVVLDGLSSPGDLGTGCQHGTAWYVESLGCQLLARLTSSNGADVRDVLADSIAAVARSHRNACDLGHPGTPSASVLMLRSSASIDCLCLFDSTLLVGTTDGVSVMSDDRVLRFAVQERQETMLHFIGSHEHRQAVQALVEAERNFRNQPGGYWVAGALPGAARESIVESYDPGVIRQAVLMTDGVSCLVTDYHRVSWADLLTAQAGRGPRELIEDVRRVEQGDPDGRRWPRYKCSDDATVVHCRF